MPRKIGAGGGFGARYGTLARRQHIEIITALRRKHECPRCRFRTVKRWSVGIWLCRKCGYKFAGGAYAPSTKLGQIAARATRGQMSPSTLSTELDSLRAGATVAPSVTPRVRRTRTRRKKPTATVEGAETQGADSSSSRGATKTGKEEEDTAKTTAAAAEEETSASAAAAAASSSNEPQLEEE